MSGGNSVRQYFSYDAGPRDASNGAAGRTSGRAAVTGSVNPEYRTATPDAASVIGSDSGGAQPSLFAGSRYPPPPLTTAHAKIIDTMSDAR